MGADIKYLRKDDAEAAANQQRNIETLEQVIASIRANRCNGMILIAFERKADGPEVEMHVDRTWIAGGIGDMMTLIGLNKVVLDEISEGSRITTNFG